MQNELLFYVPHYIELISLTKRNSNNVIIETTIHGVTLISVENASNSHRYKVTLTELRMEGVV